MRHSSKLLLSAVFVGGVLASPLLTASEHKMDSVKVGFVYVGPVGDHGWTYQHDLGRQAIEEAFGDKVETVYVENVPEGPDAERVIRRLVDEGANIVFTTSFGYMDPTLKAAEQNPDTYFEHATGYKQADNLSNYVARFYEGRYVQGVVGGLLTKSNKVGYIASFPIPEVIRGINAVQLGLNSVNPDAQVHVVWINTWYDPAKEADAAKVLIDQGVDVISAHVDSPAALQTAEERGVLAFGQASDMSHFAPQAHLFSSVNNWAPYYVKRVGQVMDDSWESEAVWDGLAEDMLVITEFQNMPDDVMMKAETTTEMIRSGEFHPFSGPINKQDGTEVIGEGEVLDDGALATMDYFVEGVQGELPN